MICNNARYIILLAIGWFTLISIACNKGTPTESGYTPNPNHLLPPLTDTIPYELLGQGKLVFERIENSSNDGVYVIDINEQRSWGIGGGVFHGPAVSPNGEQIVYSRYTSYSYGTAYDIHVMNNDGSNNQNISSIGGQDRDPSWTYDSNQVLFYVDIYPMPFYRQSPIPDPPDRELIKSFDWFEGIMGPISVSPDNKLTFDASSGIYTMDMDGSNLSHVSSIGISPVWSPDGEKIAYLSVVVDSAHIYRSLEITVMDSDGNNPFSLTTLETNGWGTWSGRNNISLCWSPDGSMLAFNKKEGYLSSHIYIINSDGSGLTQVTFAEGVTDRSLTWSN